MQKILFAKSATLRGKGYFAADLHALYLIFCRKSKPVKDTDKDGPLKKIKTPLKAMSKRKSSAPQSKSLNASNAAAASSASSSPSTEPSQSPKTTEAKVPTPKSKNTTSPKAKETPRVSH